MRGYQKELLDVLDKSGADLFALLTRLTLRQDTAEELMQELFIKLSTRKSRMSVGNFDAYVFRTAINLAFDWHRRNHKETSIGLEQCQLSVSEKSPLEKLVNTEQLQQTLRAVEKLNKNSREIIVMRYIQEASFEKIAEKTGRTPHQVRALCSKAISRLRNIITRQAGQICERTEENVEAQRK